MVCVDDAGRYAVSLLSGHIGGADALATSALMITAHHLHNGGGRGDGPVWVVHEGATDLDHEAAE